MASLLVVSKLRLQTQYIQKLSPVAVDCLAPTLATISAQKPILVLSSQKKRIGEEAS
jgi:hypothetical protein